jgi:hypothetical protein
MKRPAVARELKEGGGAGTENKGGAEVKLWCCQPLS